MSTRSIDRYAYAHDASHYLLVPQEVIKATDSDHLLHEIQRAIDAKKPITFRSGGTSLSGQGVTDATLIDTRAHFKKIEVLNNGARVRVQPGATVREVNARLARYGYKLGPDPASEAACTIGGVIANNSSGMMCGTEFNTYATLESLVVILTHGIRIDTSESDADAQLREGAPLLYQGLLRIRDEIRSRQNLVEEISRQFSIKNTMGYGVNAFLDYSQPIDILTRLIIGSEGTLAFIAEATFTTVPVKPHAATSLLLFDSIGKATEALPELVSTGLAAIELLDSTSLRVAQNDAKATNELKALNINHHAALLIEYQELTQQQLANRIAKNRDFFNTLAIANAPTFTENATTRGQLWHIRKGLYATVAGNRPSGTTALLEDIAVPINALAMTCEKLMVLFNQHRYEESVIFGHAKDGNIHFLLNEKFDDKDSLLRYSRFTEDMVELVLGNRGTLKAEHGTGRIMSPFVKRQYGDEIYRFMLEIKQLFDPNNILNPGVIISDDETLHLKNLKTIPTIEEEVDRCVECGYCEPVCPSKNLTLTPRQRIVLRRELAQARLRGDTKLVREIERQYSYDGVDTCAVDGMCQIACPVLINTGDLVRRIRAEESTAISRTLWTSLSTKWKVTTVLLGSLSRLASTLLLQRSRFVPGGKLRRAHLNKFADVIYFPSCTSTLFGGGSPDAFMQLCQKAGIKVTIPKEIADSCCGTPWKSKGMTEGYRTMRAMSAEILMKASNDGAIPIVSDSSSCTHGLSELNSDLTIVDAVTFILNNVLPTLKTRKISSLALHPTCSSYQLGINEDLQKLGKSIAEEVYVPDSWSCCGYAGDRGLLHPELTASATHDEALEINSRTFEKYASCNRTCEIGMSKSTGKNYQHIIELVNELT